MYNMEIRAFFIFLYSWLLFNNLNFLDFFNFSRQERLTRWQGIHTLFNFAKMIEETKKRKYWICETQVCAFNFMNFDCTCLYERFDPDPIFFAWCESIWSFKGKFEIKRFKRPNYYCYRKVDSEFQIRTDVFLGIVLAINIILFISTYYLFIIYIIYCIKYIIAIIFRSRNSRY
jgi:hypothetical protein